MIHQQYSIMISQYIMQEKLRKELQILKDYCKTLQTNFQNNLHVIEQREQQIEELVRRNEQLQQENKQMIETINNLQIHSEEQINHLNNDFQNKLRQKQQEMQDLTVLLQNRLRKEIQILSNKINNEAKKHKSQLSEKEEAIKRLNFQIAKLNDTVKDQKIQIFDLESRQEILIQQKNTCTNRMTLHLQELQTVKGSQQNWEQTLKQKIRQAQMERQKVQEQLSEVKLAYKQKLKKQKDQFGKKVLQLAEQKENQVRQITLEQKQMKYKFEKITNQNKEFVRECQNLKEEKNRMQNLINKYKQNQMKSNFQKNQKEFQMMQKMFDQNAKDLKNQIDSLTQEKKQLKQQLEQVNIKRESVQKAVERMKVDQKNKQKQIYELKKQNKRIKHQMEMKIREIQINMQNINNRDPQQTYNIQGSNMIQSAKIENDYSKVYTQDMGIIDDKFFEGNSPMRSPKHNKNFQFQNNVVNREAQLLKKISELQIENNQLKQLNKKLKQQSENTKKICEQQKNREISLYRDKANLYWQKSNDKEQQIAGLKQQYNDLKANYSEINNQMKIMKQFEYQNKEKEIEWLKTKQKINKLEKQNEELKEEITDLEDERKMLQEISAELRTQIHTLKDILNSHIDYQDPISQYESNYNQLEPIQYGRKQPLPQKQAQNFRETETVHTRQKIPKKLHELVRQKKTLSISGKRAAMEERGTQVRLQHVGTDSQKEIYEKIKVKNKTPPKVANYAQLKKTEKERRTVLIETASQKQVLQRLKNRNSISPERGIEKGINFLQLKYQ